MTEITFFPVMRHFALLCYSCSHVCLGHVGWLERWSSFSRNSTDAIRGQALEAATVFTDPALLGASNALPQEKILRGGMDIGMPAWGTVFTDEELQALLDYLWTFQFPQKEGRQPALRPARLAALCPGVAHGVGSITGERDVLSLLW